MDEASLLQLVDEVRGVPAAWWFALAAVLLMGLLASLAWPRGRVAAVRRLTPVAAGITFAVVFAAVLAWRLARPVLRFMVWIARLVGWLWAFMAYAVDDTLAPALVVLGVELVWQVTRGVLRGLRASHARPAGRVPA